MIGQITIQYTVITSGKKVWTQLQFITMMTSGLLSCEYIQVSVYIYKHTSYSLGFSRYPSDFSSC